MAECGDELSKETDELPGRDATGVSLGKMPENHSIHGEKQVNLLINVKGFSFTLNPSGKHFISCTNSFSSGYRKPIFVSETSKCKKKTLSHEKIILHPRSCHRPGCVGPRVSHGGNRRPGREFSQEQPVKGSDLGKSQRARIVKFTDSRFPRKPADS